MTEIEKALGKYFDEDQCYAIAKFLKAGASYAEGDAFAGVQLQKVDREDYDRLTELFAEAGFDVEFNNRMSLVGFVTSPDTDDEDLNEAIKNL